jgi:hypothetical protein
MFSVFLLFCYYIPVERGYPIPLQTLESSPSKDDLCQVWLKLAQWFWRKNIFKLPHPFLHFCDYLPFEEDLALYLNNLNSLHPRIICPKFDCFGLLVLEKILKQIQCMFTLLLLSPLREGLSPSFEQI